MLSLTRLALVRIPSLQVAERLARYHESVEAVRAKYAHLMVAVDGNRKEHEVFDDVADVLIELRE